MATGVAATSTYRTNQWSLSVSPAGFGILILRASTVPGSSIAGDSAREVHHITSHAGRNPENEVHFFCVARVPIQIEPKILELAWTNTTNHKAKFKSKPLCKQQFCFSAYCIQHILHDQMHGENVNNVSIFETQYKTSIWMLVLFLDQLQNGRKQGTS